MNNHNTEEINGTVHTVKAKRVLQGKKWWMFKWHDCYTRFEEYDSMKEYEFNLMNHLNEEEEMTDNYDSNLFSHWKEEHDYDDGPTIKHFQDD